MKSNILSMARNSMIYLSVFALITTLVLGFTPTKSFAASFSEELNDGSFEILEIIKFTDKEVVYKTLENGDVFLYEEHIEGDAVTTEKYKIDNKSKELVENFITITELNGDNIAVTQEDLLNNKITSETSVKVLPAEEVKDDVVSRFASADGWVNARGAGNNYAYYQHTSGGGSARELSNEKSTLIYNQHFNTFTKDVDKLKTFEVGILRDLAGIGLLDQAFKSIKHPTVANIQGFLKKYLKSIPGISVIVAFVDYLNLVNKAMDSYDLIPGYERNWQYG